MVLRINPSRRNHIITAESGEPFSLDNVFGEKRFELPQDWLTATLREYFYRRDIPGRHIPAPYGPYVEIAADLPGYANYPASMVLW